MGDDSSGNAWPHFEDEAMSAVQYEGGSGVMTMSGWTMDVFVCRTFPLIPTLPAPIPSIFNVMRLSPTVYAHGERCAAQRVPVTELI